MRSSLDASLGIGVGGLGCRVLGVKVLGAWLAGNLKP